MIPPTASSSPIEIPATFLKSSPLDIPSLPPLSLSYDSSDSSCSCSSTSSTFSPATSTTLSSPPRPPTHSLPPTSFHSLLIIGAGPHALAVASRLAEDRPSALYSDLEHARLSWLRRDAEGKKAKRTNVKGGDAARKLVPIVTLPKARNDVKVLDSSSSSWLGRWDGFFKGLGITHLRSPMFFHPSPAEVDALVAYAHREGREEELVAIDGVVGREKSKHARKKCAGRLGRTVQINERSREDYFRPSAALFRSFCEEDIIERYNLGSVVEQATVTSLSYGRLHVEGQAKMDGFWVESRSADGTIEYRGAKTVVIAVGPTSSPNVPKVIEEAKVVEEGKDAELEGEGWCHSAAFARKGFRFLPKELRERAKAGIRTTVVVIGGGLTAAQIGDLAIRQGVTRVILICRGQLKVRHFDFGLEWVTKYSNREKMAFWQEDARSERLAMVQQARGGGSVNPTYQRILKKHVKEEKLELKACTSVTAASYDRERKKWSLRLATLTPPVAKDAQLAEERGPTIEEIAEVDYVVCSTGSAMSFANLPFLEPLLKSHPIEMVAAFPRLTQDLQWNADLPLFVVGAYAMLELGPDAANLAGTRHGAERVAHRLAMMEEQSDGEDLEGEKQSTRQEEKESRSGGLDNYFAMLGEVED